MAGTYLVQNQLTYNDANSNRNPAGAGYQYGQRITFTQNIIIKSVWFYFVGSGGANAPLHKFQVFRVSDDARLYEQNCWLSTTVGWQEFVLTTPVSVPAGVQYSIGMLLPNGYDTWISIDASGSGTNLTGQSTPAGIDSTWWGQVYYEINGNNVGMPTIAIADSLSIRLGVDLNVLPTAPTATTTNSPVTVNTNLTANWTHNDPDANPQAKYQIRYRQT
jgi:hypothetical protein